MALRNILINPANGKNAKFNNTTNEQIVEVSNLTDIDTDNRPAVAAASKEKPYRKFFKTGASSIHLGEDGSTTPVEYTISADGTDDIYLNALTMVIGENGGDLNGFGDLGALTNGIKVELQAEGVTYDLTDGENIKTSFDAIKFGAAHTSDAGGNNAYRLNDADASSEVFMPVWNLVDLFGSKHSTRLRAGSTDFIKITVQDDLTGSDLDFFNVFVSGYCREP